MIKRGHVFVAQGDLLSLACDSVLVPTDVTLDVRPHWDRWVPTRAQASSLSWQGRVTSSLTIRSQRVRYVNTGADDWHNGVDWLRQGVREALQAATADCNESPVALHNRERPLIGMPLFGVGSGGFNAERGAALEAVLDEAHQAVETGVDVALVCYGRADYAAVQSRRHESPWSSDLSAPQIEAADDLGRRVQRGQLALFLGAGVSRAAGLPDWSALLVEMAHNCGFEPDRYLDLVQTNPPEAASLLRAHLGDGFIEALREQLPKGPHSIGHALLSSLRVGEAVTTNVDALYELASLVPFHHSLTVLPWGRTPGQPPWLLKMHGDLDKGDLVFTSEQYATFGRDNGPLGAVVQALLVTRHLVFVGYSLRDKDFVQLAREVARILHERGAGYTEVGTVLALTPPQVPAEGWEKDLRTILVGDKEDRVSAADARALEIFLDRMAWRASRIEASWLLDQRYEALLDDGDRELVRALQQLRVPDASRWHALKQVLRNYGRGQV